DLRPKGPAWLLLLASTATGCVRFLFPAGWRERLRPAPYGRMPWLPKTRFDPTWDLAGRPAPVYSWIREANRTPVPAKLANSLHRRNPAVDTLHTIYPETSCLLGVEHTGSLENVAGVYFDLLLHGAALPSA